MIVQNLWLLGNLENNKMKNDFLWTKVIEEWKHNCYKNDPFLEIRKN